MTFRIDIPDADLDDLGRRLAATRFPNVPGERTDLLRRLIERWRDGYDWRAHEAELNRFDHRVATVGGVDLHHVVHPAAPTATGVPIVALHGFPDSFHRFTRLAPLLAAAGHDVVVPSLPGFTFSGQPEGPLTVEGVAELVHELVTGLGHERYVAHGGDWGGAVAEQLATAHPEAVVALHLTDVPYAHQFGVDRAGASDAEVAFLDAGEAWAEGAAYFTVQSTAPDLLGAALSDSPAGLAAWLSDLFVAWSDREPDLDELLTHVSLYWHTNCIRSSFRLYAEGLGDWDAEDWSAGGGDWSGEGDGCGGEDPAGGGGDSPTSGDDWSGGGGGWGGRLEVPTALALFPADIGVPPREFAQRFFDVRRFTLMAAGGHFGAAEEPEALAADIVAFLADLADLVDSVPDGLG